MAKLAPLYDYMIDLLAHDNGGVGMPDSLDAFALRVLDAAAVLGRDRDADWSRQVAAVVFAVWQSLEEIAQAGEGREE